MQAKKKLIAKLAFWTGVVLLVAIATGTVVLLIDNEQRTRHADQQEREKKQRIESARAYLAELAKKIGKLPVDPALAGEVEARYYEEQASGPSYVWAMDTRGDFVFGVPQSAFAKVNAVYDQQVEPLLKDGVFLDRQTFLLNLVDDADELGAEAMRADQAADLVERGRRFHFDRWEPENTFVLSAPLKAENGTALGSLYLKRRPLRREEWYRRDPSVEAAGRVALVTAVGSFFFLWVLLPTWVYVDARERGVRRAPLFAFLTVISSLVGLVVYLIARPEETRRLTCPGCAREVNGGQFCPHCGRDLSSAICATCRYPLKPDWAFCPACRTEIKPQAAGTPVPEAG